MSKQISIIDEVRGTLQKMESQFKAALPTHITPQKFIRVAMTAIQTNPRLLDCDRRSLFAELIKCSQDGLVPDGAEASIIPYGNQAKYTPQIKGICKRARNSGEIASLDSQVVYERDEYTSWTDEKGPHFKHVKARGDRGQAILTYAYAITKDGSFYFEEIDETQMQAIESCSKGKDSPWKGNFKDEMKRKSAMKRLCKYRLPSSADLDGMLDRDADLFGEVQPAIDQPTATREVTKETPAITKVEKKTRPKRLAEAIDVTPEQEPEQETEEAPI
jgi:recombination protein RecT